MASRSTSLLYLVHRETLSSVISSQVITPLEHLRPDTEVTLGLMTPLGHLWRNKYAPTLKRIEERCRASGIRVAWIPSPPTRLPWLWSDAFVLRQWIRKHFSADQPLVVRCRNATTTSIALDALRGFSRAHVIYDRRGAEITEEVQKWGLDSIPQKDWPPHAKSAITHVTAAEHRAVHQATGITCVSNAMVDELCERYPTLNRDKFFVAPCCPEITAFDRVISERDNARMSLGLSDRFIVSYVGSLAWYQLPQASIRLFRLIKTAIPLAHLLAITTEPDKMKRLLETSSIDSSDYTIRSVPPRDVPGLLIASDMGLLLRDNTLTNRVASPIKFGEYMAAGVPVLITPSLGDYSAAVVHSDLGIEVDLQLDDSTLLSRLGDGLTSSSFITPTTRHRCRQFAAANLSWQAVLPAMASWLNRLTERSAKQDAPG